MHLCVFLISYYRKKCFSLDVVVALPLCIYVWCQIWLCASHSVFLTYMVFVNQAFNCMIYIDKRNFLQPDLVQSVHNSSLWFHCYITFFFAAPKAFEIKREPSKTTVAVDPFSKDREYDIPTGDGFKIKKSDKPLTEFDEFKKGESSWTVSYKPLIINLVHSPKCKDSSYNSLVSKASWSTLATFTKESYNKLWWNSIRWSRLLLHC